MIMRWQSPLVTSHPEWLKMAPFRNLASQQELWRKKNDQKIFFCSLLTQATNTFVTRLLTLWHLGSCLDFLNNFHVHLDDFSFVSRCLRRTILQRKRDIFTNALQWATLCWHNTNCFPPNENLTGDKKDWKNKISNLEKHNFDTLQSVIVEIIFPCKFVVTKFWWKDYRDWCGF